MEACRRLAGYLQEPPMAFRLWLVPLDSSSQSLIKGIHKLGLNSRDLLPYEFNAVDGSASDQQSRSVAAACIACLGLLGLLLGLRLYRVRSRPAHGNAVAVTAGWSLSAKRPIKKVNSGFPSTGAPRPVTIILQR
jgi:hypothetical protein